MVPSKLVQLRASWLHATRDLPPRARTIALSTTTLLHACLTTPSMYAARSAAVVFYERTSRIIKVSFDSTTGVKFISFGSRVAIVSAVK